MALAACGGNATETAEAVIETEISENVGLGNLEATCEEPLDREVGTTYGCTATTTDGQTLTFITKFTAEDEIFVQPSNLLVASEIPVLREQAAATLGPEIGVDIDPESIECPTADTIVLDENGELECTITRSDDGVVFALTIRLENFDFDDGFQNLFVQVGDEPIG